MAHRASTIQKENLYQTLRTLKRIATIGFFDGLHLGHQFVLSALLERAEQYALQPLVVTFQQSPYLPDTELLLPAEERIVRLQQIVGKDNVLVFEFADIQHFTAREFMLRLRDEYHMQQLLMGFDQRFGSDQPAHFEDYQKIGSEIDVEAVKLMRTENCTPSSRSCRSALKNGQIEALNEMLGQPFQLTGKVVRGRGIGHKIGFPTANLELPPRLLPKAGVYVVSVELGIRNLDLLLIQNSKFKIQNSVLGLLNIGTNPTVQGTALTAEVHIIDYQGDLYGETLTVSLLHYLREEQTFASLDALKEQIKQDIQHVIFYDWIR